MHQTSSGWAQPGPYIAFPPYLLVRFKWVQGGNSREIKTEESKKRRERGEYGKGGKERILSLMVEITGSLLVIGVEDTEDSKPKDGRR